MLCCWYQLFWYLKCPFTADNRSSDVGNKKSMFLHNYCCVCCLLALWQRPIICQAIFFLGGYSVWVCEAVYYRKWNRSEFLSRHTSIPLGWGFVGLCWSTDRHRGWSPALIKGYCFRHQVWVFICMIFVSVFVIVFHAGTKKRYCTKSTRHRNQMQP